MAKEQEGFSEEEKAEMKERAKEFRADRNKAKQDPRGDLM